MLQLREWFNAVDRDGSGQICAKELQRALALGNLRFSLSVTAQMIRQHDADGSGFISFPEFEELHGFLTNMQQSFLYFDRDRGGSLSQPEVYEALQHAGFTLTAHSMGAVMRAFDPDRNLQLGLPEFIAMTLFLKGCKAAFKAFDPRGTNEVRFNFDQFLYAAANAR